METNNKFRISALICFVGVVALLSFMVGSIAGYKIGKIGGEDMGSGFVFGVDSGVDFAQEIRGVTSITGMAAGEFGCNNDSTCDPNESVSSCPSDCANICGNGIIENDVNYSGTLYNETCDGTNFNGLSCSSYGYNYGSLSCGSSRCVVSTSGCYNCLGDYEPDSCNANCSNVNLSSVYFSGNPNNFSWRSLDESKKLIVGLENKGPYNTRSISFDVIALDFNFNLSYNESGLHFCNSTTLQKEIELIRNLSYFSDTLCESEIPSIGASEYEFRLDTKYEGVPITTSANITTNTTINSTDNSTNTTITTIIYNTTTINITTIINITNTKTFKINITDFCFNATCGDGTCSYYENSTTCLADCECTPGEKRACGSDKGICSKGNQTCTSYSKWGSCIGNIGSGNETCNNLDDDCDGEVDEGFDWDGDGKINDTEVFDYDGDGYYPKKTIYKSLKCTNYTDFDCNDNDSRIYPGALERLNGIDDDCDGKIDENVSEGYLEGSKINLGTLQGSAEARLRESEWAIFRFNNIRCVFEAEEVTTSGVLLNILIISDFNMSSLEGDTILIGDSKKYDLDYDGKDDVSIKLAYVRSGFEAHLTVQDLSAISNDTGPGLPCNNNGVCDSNETAASCPNDCLVVDYCNNNGVCDEKETGENCPGDCKKEINETEQNKTNQGEPVPVTKKICNNNGVCENLETEANCPNDCKKGIFKSPGSVLKFLIPFAAAVAAVLGIIFGGALFKTKVDPYSVNKRLKQIVIKTIDSGYNLYNIGDYLTSQNVNRSAIKKALRYSSDFMALRNAITFYVSQGHNEREIKEMCVKNRWSRKIVNDVFVNIHVKSGKISGAHKGQGASLLSHNVKLKKFYKIKNFK